MNRIERKYTSKEDMFERVKQRLLRKGGALAVKDAEKLELDTFAIKDMAAKSHIEMADKNLPIYKLMNPSASNELKEDMRNVKKNDIKI